MQKHRLYLTLALGLSLLGYAASCYCATRVASALSGYAPPTRINDLAPAMLRTSSTAPIRLTATQVMMVPSSLFLGGCALIALIVGLPRKSDESIND
jgi:hypothetical protein